MHKLMRAFLVGSAAVATAGLLVAVFSGVNVPWRAARAAEAAEAPAEEPAPPADQAYTGSKRCSSCHFEQYLTWKQTKHAEAFQNLPTKYKQGADTQCFSCHITGYGDPQGYKGASTADLLGVTCEACHGPGSKHEETCKPFAQAKELTPEQKKAAVDSIWRIKPGKVNACADCHLIQQHKKHPEYEKE